MRGLITGIGALAAAAAAGTGVYVNGQNAPAAAPSAAELRVASAPSVCIHSNVRLVEGMTRGCLTPADFEALRDRPVLGGDGKAVEVNLAGPDPQSNDAAARTCAQYDSLSAEGWFALSNADMRREEYFKRACGALSMLVKAKPAQSTHFSGGAASAEDIRSMASHDALAFGPGAPSASVVVSSVEQGVWDIEIGNGETMVFEIAHADFNGDGLGEILAYVSVGAIGGTARTGSIGLIEKPLADGPCEFSPR